MYWRGADTVLQFAFYVAHMKARACLCIELVSFLNVMHLLKSKNNFIIVVALDALAFITIEPAGTLNTQ